MSRHTRKFYTKAHELGEFLDRALQETPDTEVKRHNLFGAFSMLAGYQEKISEYLKTPIKPMEGDSAGLQDKVQSKWLIRGPQEIKDLKQQQENES